MAQELSQGQVFTGNINSFNVSTHHNNTINVNTSTEDERRQILEWLSPLDTRNRHQDLSSDRLDGIGNWLLETGEFRKWRDSENESSGAVLFCCGNPGVGKTYLNSLVIDSLCDEDVGRATLVVGLYCDFVAQQEQSPANMLGAILKQLVSGGEIPDCIRQAFQKAKKELDGRCPRLPDLVKLVKATIALLPRVFICIDALDELLPRHRLELLGSFRDIVLESPGTRVLLTARPHIKDEIKKFFTEAVTIPISPAKVDIETYLEMRLERDTEPNAMDDDLRADIVEIIPELICEIFLLVSLNMDAILGEVTIDQRRRKLLEMTEGSGLGDAYSTTLARMRAQKGSKAKLGMDVLMWVSHAERPLKTSELCYALGVETGSKDLNPQRIPAIQTLVSCSLGLVTVEASSSTVRLIHFTLKEYLCQDSTLFHNPRLVMSEICLTYLNFVCVRNLPLVPHQALKADPFVQYASYFWGAGLRGEIAESVKGLALSLLDAYGNHVSSQLLLHHELGSEYCRWEEGTIFKGFTGLHCVAYLGLGGLAIALLEMKEWDLSATDNLGNTAISWAARKGNEEVVKLLLEQNGVNPDTSDKEGRTPLSWAAERGHATVVMTLLKRNDVNPDTADEESRTPLSRAAGRGHARVVRILLGRNDVNPNMVDQRGRTPLLQAAMYGYEAVVTALLERKNVNPNIEDEDGRTPLLWAALNRHKGVMKTLLRRDGVNPNTVDRCGRTPLLHAAMYKYEEVVELLLQRNDMNPDIADKDSRTPLSRAAEKGHAGVVKMLLGRSDVNPNTADREGRTPLSLAAEKRHSRVVKMLLGRNDVNSNTVDREGQTPFSWAAAGGNPTVLVMFLERNNVNTNTVDQHGQNPLLKAAMYGYEEAVKTLLERSDFGPDTADDGGRTPLSWAAERGHVKVLKTLLERNDVNPDTADGGGRTPLSWAAGRGRIRAVKMLLERNDVNPDTADGGG